MEPYQILAQGISHPDRLGVLFDAFNAAWVEIEPIVRTDLTKAAGAQEKLARAILLFDRYSFIDLEWIKDAAIAIVREDINRA